MEYNNTIIKQEDIYPMLSLRGLVLFPKMLMHFEVGRKKSIAAMKAAMDSDQKIFLIAQKDILVENPEPKEHYSVGVVATIKQIIKANNDIWRVVIEGDYRAKISEIVQSEPFYKTKVVRYDIKYNTDNVSDYDTALTRGVKELFFQYAKLVPQMPKEIERNVIAHDSPLFVCEYVSENINVDYKLKQEILNLNSVTKRLELLIKILKKEISVLEIELDINQKVKSKLEKNQRDYYLREQMRIISEELGDGDSPEDELYDYSDRIMALKLDNESEEKLFKEVNKLSKMPYNSNDSAVIRTYLDTVLGLPFNKLSKENNDLTKAKKILDRDHYGLCDVKEKILELLAVRQLSGETSGHIICLVGPPGVGKTSVAKSIATATGRKYARISLGGVKDESDIRGHRKTYIGAMPGRIIDAFSKVKTSNPLILFDEIDKMSNDYKGDPASAMLEVLDPEQNKTFTDHYIEIPFDVSKALFITTANTIDSIPDPLLDRMEIIELSSYTPMEKENIATKYLVPKQIKKNGLSAKQLKIDKTAIKTLIENYTKEAGVRQLEREIVTICRKTALSLLTNNKTVTKVNSENIESILGPKKFISQKNDRVGSVGCVNGLAFTQIGGVVMPLEVSVFEGTGKVELTGCLGEVMKESAKTAISYIRSVADKYGVSADFYTKKDIHIHAPESAVPKDGPSAGIALTSVILSALSGVVIRNDVAMTGEVTLHGKVLAIGGLKEKLTAAYVSGIKNVIIPADNLGDVYKLPEEIKQGVNIKLVDNVEDVFDFVFYGNNQINVLAEETSNSKLASIRN